MQALLQVSLRKEVQQHSGFALVSIICPYRITARYSDELKL